jgi:hypothetical protein
VCSSDLSNPEDYENWLECNGQSTAGYPDLAAIVGATVPNYKGMFLRGYGSQNHSKNNGSTVGVTGTTHSSGDLGAIQGDAIRNIVGSLDTGALERNQFVDVAVVSGAIKTRRGIKQYTQDPPYEGNLRPSGFDFDSSLVVPDANENRPVNTAVRYLIRAKP